MPLSGVNTLHLYFPTNIPTPNIVYYQSTSGNVEVNVSWCSDDSGLTSQYHELFANTTNEADNVMVFVGTVNSHLPSFLYCIYLLSLLQLYLYLYFRTI
jgi:hypothetical protein